MGGAYSIPDCPLIRNMESTGLPDGIEPETPRCPICGGECSEFFIRDAEIIGCDECAHTRDAWEYVEEMRYAG